MALKTVTSDNSLPYPLDVAQLQAAVIDLQTKLTLICAKLDDDATVTDTNYEAQL